MNKLVVMVSLVLVGTALPAAEGTNAVPGEDSPKKLLERAVAAHKEGCLDLLASCFPAGGKVVAELEWLMTESGARIVSLGETKFGEEGFWQAIGSPGLMIHSLARKPPYELLLEKGSPVITGEEAVYSYETREDSKIKYKDSAHMRQIGGRWFFDAPALKNLESTERAKEAFQRYLESLAFAIDKASNQADLVSLLKEPNRMLVESLKSNQPSVPSAKKSAAPSEP